MENVCRAWYYSFSETQVLLPLVPPTCSVGVIDNGFSWVSGDGEKRLAINGNQSPHLVDICFAEWRLMFMVLVRPEPSFTFGVPETIFIFLA